MEKKDDAIEKIDEQIKKLENKENSSKTVVEKGQTTTKVFELSDNDETKIFDGEEVISSATEEVELLEDLLETKKTEVTLEEKTEEKTIEKKSVVKKKKSKKPLVIVIILVLILLVLTISGIFLTSVLLKDKDKEEVENIEKLTDDERKEVLNMYGSLLESIINIYYSKENELLEYDDAVKLVDFDYEVNCDIHEIYKSGKVYLNKCSVNGIRTDHTYGEEYVEEVSEDEILTVYEEKVSKKVSLEQPKGSTYDTYTVHCGSKYSEAELVGDYVIYYDADYNLQMKNYKTDEKILKDISYQGIWPLRLSNGSYDPTYILVKINNFWGVYDYVMSEQIISPRYTSFLPYLYTGVGDTKSVQTIEGHMVVAWNGEYYGVINYVTNRIVIPFEYNIINLSGNYIWATKDNGEGHLFDLEGNRQLENKYTAIYGVVDEKILVNDSQVLKLVNGSGEIIHTYDKIDNIGSYSFGIYYNNQVIFQFLDTASTDKCIEVIYDTVTKEGSSKSVVCGGIG